MLSINKERGEIRFSYDSDGGPVQGRIGYFQLTKDRIAFTLTGQTTNASVPVRDIGMLLKALGDDLIVDAWRSSKTEPEESTRPAGPWSESEESLVEIGDDGSITASKSEETEPNGPDLRHTYRRGK
jgi:hypothetical protein